jgi:hypothetical protein
VEEKAWGQVVSDEGRDSNHEITTINKKQLNLKFARQKRGSFEGLDWKGGLAK